MKAYLGKLTSNIDGAATVDWIVLTGLVVGLTLSVMAMIGNGADSGSAGLVAPASINTEF